MQGQPQAAKKAPQPRVGSKLRNKLSGMEFIVIGLERTKRGRAWTLDRNGFRFTCHVNQLAARYEVLS